MFYCPKLQLALRNPLKIARLAHEISQDRGKNLLDYGVLKSPIDTSRSLVNIKDCLLINNQKLLYKPKDTSRVKTVGRAATDTSDS